jgi:uncharacterized protein (DUF2236 family)
VVGAVEEDAGDFAAGDRYAANDVGYLTWVWATLVDTLLVVQDRFSGGLSLNDKRAYVVESSRFAALFGLGPEHVPGTYEDFKYYFNEMIASGSLAITRPAKEVASFLFEPSTPSMAPLMSWYRLVTGLLLPARLAEGFGMVATRTERLLARGSLMAVGISCRRLPAAMRYVPAYLQAQARMGGGTVAAARLSIWQLVQTALARSTSTERMPASWSPS